jgi:hypothetical protein
MDNKLQHNNSVLKLHMTFVADTNDSKKEDLIFTRGTLCSNATTTAKFDNGTNCKTNVEICPRLTSHHDLHEF